MKLDKAGWPTDEEAINQRDKEIGALQTANAEQADVPFEGEEA